MPQSKGGVKGTYADKFYATVTESAAGTLTFGEIRTNINRGSSVGWILHRIEWMVGLANWNALADASDAIHFALTASDKITTLDMSDPGVIDWMEVTKKMSTDVGFQTHVDPTIRDFANMPGGGILIYPSPLFVAVQGVSIATARTAVCRGYYTQIDLSDKDFIDLIGFYSLTR